MDNEIKHCECGCNKIVNKGRRFIHGHSSKRKIPWMKGRKHTEASKEKMRGRIPWNKGIPQTEKAKEKNRKAHIGLIGYRHTKESKKKISESRKGIGLGIKHTPERIKKAIKARKSRVGYKHSKETLKKIYETREKQEWGRGRKQTPEHTKNCADARRGYKHTDEYKKKMSKMMSKRIASGYYNKYKNTQPEKAVEKMLQDMNLNYEKQKYISNVGCVDFFLTDYNIPIECDGDYWHNLEGAQERDTMKNLNAMSFHNYKILRFWEHEINDSPEKCIKKIEKEIEICS